METNHEVRKLREKDREILLSFLYPRRTEALFLLSNLERGDIEGGQELFEGDYFGFFHEEKLRGVLMQVRQGSLLIACSHPLGQFELAKAFLQHHQKKEDESPGQVHRILGLNEEVQGFFEVLEEHSLWKSREVREAALLVLTKDTLESRPQLFVRLAQESDIDVLLKWKKSFRVDAMGDDPSWIDEEVLRESLELGIQEKRQFILEQHSKPVSMARLNAVSGRVAQLGGVFTPKEHRGKGYASKMVSGLANQCLVENFQGEFVGDYEALVLTVDEESKKALKIYRDLGFLGLGTFRFHLVEDPVFS